MAAVHAKRFMKTQLNFSGVYKETIGLIRAAAILAIDNRFCTPTFGSVGQNKSFQSLGTQHGHLVIKAHRRVHALECIMVILGKMERNSKVCKEVQNDEKYS